jgi:hypothetical protein
MIERYVGDDAQARLDYIGCIQAAAHPNFKHKYIRTAASKILEGHRGQHFKEAGMPGQIAFFYQAFGGAIDYVVDHREVFVVDGSAIQANALVDAD